MIFKLYECEVGIKRRGVSYKFPHVSSVEIEDGERNRLTRGANADDNIGLAFKDGLKEPKRWTIPMMNMSIELKEVLDECYTTQERLDVYVISKKDGSSKMAKNAVLSNMPQQLTLDETAESMAVSLEFETFDSSENHKA